MNNQKSKLVKVRMRALPLSLRQKLKCPLGRLIQGTSDKTMLQLKKLIEKEKPPRIIAVGDVVSANMTKHGIHPSLAIVDNKSLRESIQPVFVETDQTKYLRNPPGTLADDALDIVKEALEQELRTKIVIDGEEDLLALIAVLCAPENSFVVYGQPHKGIVVVKVSSRNKGKVRRIMSAMEDVSKN